MTHTQQGTQQHTHTHNIPPPPYTGQDGWACRAEVAQPWSTDMGSVLHELGHMIGLHHASSRGGLCMGIALRSVRA